MTKRQSLVKLLPRRFIPDSETSLVSGSVYRTTFIDVEPSAVYQDTTSLSFTYTSGQLDFTVVAGAPNSNIFVDYPLYFCLYEANRFHDDPVAETGNVVDWEPRLSQHAVMKQSSKDLLFGTFSISMTNISIINIDYGLANHFTKYDNYLNRPYFAYGKIGENNVFLLNSGTIKSVNYGQNISLNIKDNVSKLDAIATMGNAKAHYEFNSTDYPNGNSGRFGEAIPISFGRLSQSPNFMPNELNTDFNRVDETGLFKCLEIDPSTKEFVIGVAVNPYPADGLTVAVTDNGPIAVGTINYRNLTVSGIYLKSILIGSNIAISLDGGTTWGSVSVYYVDVASNTAWIDAPAAITHIKVPSCYYGYEAIYGPTVLAAAATMECTHSLTVSGDTFIKVKPNATLLLYPNLVRQLAEKGCVITNDTDVSQTDYVERLIGDAGFDPQIKGNAQTLADNYVQVTHGLNREMETYRELIGNLANSNNGIAYTLPEFNSGLQVMAYRIIYNAMNTDTDITIYNVFGYEILEPEIKLNVSYQDIYSRISCTNPTIIGSAKFFGTTANAESVFTENLYGVDRLYSFNTVNIDAQDSVDDKIDFLKEPINIYEFSLDAEDFIDKANIGDIFRLKDLGDKLPIQTTDLDLLIIGVERSATTIKVTGYEYSKIS